MREIYLLLLLVSSASGLLTSCTTEEPWPPFADRVTHVFHDNQVEFAELENRLLKSKYFEVSLLGTTDAYGKFVDADAIVEEQIVSNGHIWAELLVKTGTLGVKRSEIGTAFVMGIDPFKSTGDAELSKIGRLVVVHSEHLFSELDQCNDSHRPLTDGRCYVPLGGNWSAVYFWKTN